MRFLRLTPLEAKMLARVALDEAPWLPGKSRSASSAALGRLIRKRLVVSDFQRAEKTPGKNWVYFLTEKGSREWVKRQRASQRAASCLSP